MEKQKYDRAAVTALLKTEYVKLTESGENRYPRRSDFSEDEVSAIKSLLGPWPRALEAAGIKPERDDGRSDKNKEKRIRAKRRRRQAQKSEGSPPDLHDEK